MNGKTIPFGYLIKRRASKQGRCFLFLNKARGGKRENLTNTTTFTK